MPWLNPQPLCVDSLLPQKKFLFVSNSQIVSEIVVSNLLSLLCTDMWIKKVEGYKSWFVEEEKYCTDEKKRPGKPKTQQDLFGLEGSFRSLNVD